MKTTSKNFATKTLLACAMALSVSAFADTVSEVGVSTLTDNQINPQIVSQEVFELGQPSIENNPNYVYVMFERDIMFAPDDESIRYEQVAIGSVNAKINGELVPGNLLLAKVAGENKVFYHIFESDEAFDAYINGEVEPDLSTEDTGALEAEALEAEALEGEALEGEAKDTTGDPAGIAVDMPVVSDGVLVESVDISSISFDEVDDDGSDDVAEEAVQ